MDTTSIETNDFSILTMLDGLELLSMVSGPIGLMWQPGDGQRYLVSLSRAEGRLAHETSGSSQFWAWHCTFFAPCRQPRTIVSAQERGRDAILDPHYIGEHTGVSYNTARAMAVLLNIALPHCSTLYGLEMLGALAEFAPDVRGFVGPAISDIAPRSVLETCTQRIEVRIEGLEPSGLPE